MNKEAVIERERRFGRPAGIVGFVGIVLFFFAGAVGLAPDFNGAGDDPERLRTFADESNGVLAQLLIQALGMVLLIPPLYLLFRAVDSRKEDFRSGLIGLTIAGPLFFAGSLVATWFVFDAASAQFLDAPQPPGDQSLGDYVDDLLADQTATRIASGLQLAGVLALVVSTIYTSLNAMRVGLMTRFVGTLGMALGASMVILGLPVLLAFFLVVSLLVANIWPGKRPPAWDAGVAVPWPKPGEETETGEEREEELARPEDFDGSGRELEPEPPPEIDAGPAPADDDGPRKRKRKQRG
jgi:hypothetical protein